MSRELRRQILVALAAVVALALASPPAAWSVFNVSGTITDSSGTPLQNIRLSVWDEDGTLDQLLGTVHTGASGAYSVAVSGGFGSEDPDVYVRVEWAFNLFPPAGSTYSGAQMLLVNTTTINSCAADPGVTVFTAKSSAVTADHDPNVDLVIDLAMDQSLANVENLRAEVNRAIDYYESNKGTVSWSLSADVPVKVRVMSSPGSFYCQNNGTIYIAQQDITGTAGGFISDIYHEMGHLIHHRFEVGNLPFGGFSGSHSVNTESDPEFALKEGWPSYVAELTDSSTGGANDNKYQVFRDTARTHWRGDEPAPPGPTGYPAGATESGERVEGALGGLWFAIDDDALWTFSDNFRVMVDDHPDHIFGFCKGFVADAGGAGTGQTLQLYHHMQNHGIVYNRGRFAPDPLDAPAPPDTTPPSDGNLAEIRDFTFLRGKVTATIEEMAAGDLGVNQTVDNEKVRVGYHTASDGLSGSPGAFLGFTPPENFGGSSTDVELDTETFGSGSGDGHWDLLVVAENEDGFRDNHLPTWNGDGNTAVNSDERYLKVIGAWYDKDRNPATNTIKEGMVVVDNTAPEVSNCKPVDCSP